MMTIATDELTQELFQILGQVTRLKWEGSPIYGLKQSECELLGIIYINLSNGSKSIAASDLSNQLNITPAAITHILNPLEKAGFITRQKDPNDRRFVMIRLTERGAKVGKSLLQDAHEVLDGLVQHLGEDNSRKLLVLITELLNYFSENPYEQ